ncbi:DUF7768 domain-containing protein [Youngiibacter fragilis]|uniref:DUF7768 domain-containing protein n=1 Tax=Youngiibacter fragilis 232.1 TaxID=994573 RepID=V7I422_9CLOT|nr:DUF4406 domain-containing protein [Youngiibacter fragilis]ETA80603.1 hypothetical protein T472_0211110 [Youngiibacter fragilis 232.1]
MNEQMRSKYGTGGVDKKNSEGYSDPTVYEALRNIKKEDKVFRPLVFICSPYAGDIEKNTERAKMYSRFAVFERNAIAFAPHLLLPLYLSDDDPEERELALFMDIVFLGKCNELWVFGEKITNGMQREIDKAKKRCMKIRYFTEDMEEVESCS